MSQRGRLQYLVPSYAFEKRVLLAAFPSAVLGAAVLAAEEVSFVLVGSAALWLRDEIAGVADADAVIEPGERNIHRLRGALAGIAVGPVPSVDGLSGGSVVPVVTAYGKVDCLMERGRRDWAAPPRRRVPARGGCPRPGGIQFGYVEPQAPV